MPCCISCMSRPFVMLILVQKGMKVIDLLATQHQVFNSVMILGLLRSNLIPRWVQKCCANMHALVLFNRKNQSDQLHHEHQNLTYHCFRLLSHSFIEHLHFIDSSRMLVVFELAWKWITPKRSNCFGSRLSSLKLIVFGHSSRTKLKHFALLSPKRSI